MTVPNPGVRFYMHCNLALQLGQKQSRERLWEGDIKVFQGLLPFFSTAWGEKASVSWRGS
jgi:hypothetical protein